MGDAASSHTTFFVIPGLGGAAFRRTSSGPHGPVCLHRRRDLPGSNTGARRRFSLKAFLPLHPFPRLTLGPSFHRRDPRALRESRERLRRQTARAEQIWRIAAPHWPRRLWQTLQSGAPMFENISGVSHSGCKMFCLVKWARGSKSRSILSKAQNAFLILPTCHHHAVVTSCGANPHSQHHGSISRHRRTSPSRRAAGKEPESFCGWCRRCVVITRPALLRYPRAAQPPPAISLPCMKMATKYV